VVLCHFSYLDKYENGKKENARAPAQKPEDIVKEERFRQARRFLRDGKITHSVYKQEILEMHQFLPKKKYIEELEDTDESDPPSASEDSSENDEADEEADEENDVEPPQTETVEPPQTETVEPPQTETVEPPQTETVEPPQTETVEPPQTETVEPPQTETVEPPQTETVEPPQTETVEPPQIIRTTTPTDEQSRTVDSCLINLRNTACCAQPRDYGCPPNDIDEDYLNEIEDRPTFY
jgi:hypothetical protein